MTAQFIQLYFQLKQWECLHVGTNLLGYKMSKSWRQTSFSITVRTSKPILYLQIITFTMFGQSLIFFIQRSSSYRAENTLHLGYKTQSV